MLETLKNSFICCLICWSFITLVLWGFPRFASKIETGTNKTRGYTYRVSLVEVLEEQLEFFEGIGNWFKGFKIK